MKNREIKFGSVAIAENRPTVIIAEIACQHGGNMSAAKRLVDAAKKAGADIAKFQLHIAEAEMVSGSINFWGGSMDEILKRANFRTQGEHKQVADYCKKVGIQYLCTPFCIEAVDILEKIGTEAYKTGSGELTNLPIMRHIARKRKPMIVSTGMSKMEEIADTVKVLKAEKAEFMITHCLSEYPAKYEHMNLGLINELKKRFGVLVGWSDHSTEINSAVAAVALGAKVIEKHFTLPSLRGPDDNVSLKPKKFKEMVSAIRKIERALGDEKVISKEEQVVRDWAHHSVVAVRDICQGEAFSLKNLAPKRPGCGIPARYLDPMYSRKILGKKAARNLNRDTILQWKDVKHV